MVPTLDERRSSPRLPLGRIVFWVRGVPHVGRGDVSLGGCFWKGDSVPPQVESADVSFSVPGVDEEIRLHAKVLHRRYSAGLYAIHMQFSALPKRIEDGLGGFIDEWFSIADASGLLGI